MNSSFMVLLKLLIMYTHRSLNSLFPPLFINISSIYKQSVFHPGFLHKKSLLVCWQSRHSRFSGQNIQLECDLLGIAAYFGDLFSLLTNQNLECINFLWAVQSEWHDNKIRPMDIFPNDVVGSFCFVNDLVINFKELPENG